MTTEAMMRQMFFALLTFFCATAGHAAPFSPDVVHDSTQSPQMLQRTAWFAQRPDSFADLAERVEKAVVNISTSKLLGRPQMRRPGGIPGDPFDEFFNRFFEGQPGQQKQHSLGSGFIINKSGVILTNSHVVAGASEIEVRLSDGRKFKAKVVGQDERTDIAVIKIDAKADLPFVEMGDSSAVRPGEWVMAIGNPFGLQHSVTVGVVSATGRVIGGGPYAKFIQTDASINPGNSGGPLFDMQGRVIGINTMIFANGQGIGFAIPIDLAKQLLPQLMEKGSVTRGWLGVSVQDITPELAKSFGLEEGAEGALIAEVFEGSPAAKAGLQRGDIITKFDNQNIKDPYELTLMVGNAAADSVARLQVLRRGETKTIEVKIGKQQEEGVARQRTDQGAPLNGDALGLVVRPMTPQTAQQLGLPANISGVLIERIQPDSSAEQADLRAGDVLQEINGQRIASVEEYSSAVRELKSGSIVRLLVRRGPASIFVAFRL